jgi:geranylgeranyl pyrophosphate synthase
MNRREKIAPADPPQSLQAEALDRLHAYVDNCRSHLVAGLSGEPEGALVADYFQNGKMIRSLLVFACASAAGGDPACAMCAAEAIELLHGASLFHDDLIDGAGQRRGLPALHHRLSTDSAIVLGDYLLLRAFTVLCEARAVAHSAAVLDTIRVLGSQARACCRGQLQELGIFGEVTSEGAYITMVEGKTAAPFVAAAVTGAILANAGKRERKVLASYAMNLGVAFQICDDMLDLCGDANVIGKPVGNSLARGRPLLPLIFLEKYGSPTARAQWKALREQGGPLRELQSILRAEGIDKRVRAAQHQYLAAGVASLAGMRNTDGLQVLLQLPGSALSCWQ